MGLTDTLWNLGSGALYALDTPRALSHGTIGNIADYFRGVDYTPGTGISRGSGRDMLRSLGFVGNDRPGMDLGDAAGFATELVLDPLNLVPAGLAAKLYKSWRGGRAAAKSLSATELASDYAPSLLRRLNPGLPGKQRLLGIDGPEASRRLLGLPAPPALAGLPAPVPPFYSRLERAAEWLPGKKFQVKSLRNNLIKAPEGVSKVEMDWVLKGLEERGGVVTKEELLRHIRDNAIGVKKHVTGNRPYTQYQITHGLEGEHYRHTGSVLPGVSHTRPGVSREEVVDAIEAWRNHDFRANANQLFYNLIPTDRVMYPETLTSATDLTNPAKFSEYAYYRGGGPDDEWYTTVVNQSLAPSGPGRQMYDMVDEDGYVLLSGFDPSVVAGQTGVTPAGLKYHFTPSGHTTSEYIEPHFGRSDPLNKGVGNVMSHARYTVDPAALGYEQIPRLQEVQSTWSQHGDKYGYAGDPATMSWGVVSRGGRRGETISGSFAGNPYDMEIHHRPLERFPNGVTGGVISRQPGSDTYRAFLRDGEGEIANEIFQPGFGIPGGQYDVMDDMYREMYDHASALEQRGTISPVEYESMMDAIRLDARDKLGKQMEMESRAAREAYGVRDLQELYPREFSDLDSAKRWVEQMSTQSPTNVGRVRSGDTYPPNTPFRDKLWADVAVKSFLDDIVRKGYKRFGVQAGNLTAKHNAGGVEGATAEALERWMGRDLPAIIERVYKKYKMKRGTPTDETFSAMFDIPEQLRRDILTRGQPLLSLMPFLAGGGYALSQREPADRP